MAEKELQVGISLDRSGAKADAQAFRQDMQALNASLLSDARRTENAKTQVARDAQGRFIAGSRAARTAVVADLKATEEAARSSYGNAAQAGVNWFVKLEDMEKAGRARLGGLMELVNGLASAFDRAGERSRAMADQFADRRESLRNLAALQGVEADDAFTLKQARFAKATGTTFPEAVAAQTAFMNSGAQFVGKSMSAGQAEVFQKGLATMGAARNIDQGVMSDLGGRLLGMKDYSKFGDRAAEMALGDAQRVIAVLSAGQGEEGQLSREVGKLAATAQSEDETRGVFQDPAEVAEFISVMAEGKVEGQAEAVQSGLRGLRGFSRPKGGKTLAAAGVTPEDSPRESLRKVGEYAQREADKQGLKPQDVLNQSFDDSLAAEAIGVLYNRGIAGGAFESREATAAAAGPEAAAGANAAFLRSKTGRKRVDAADLELARLERGAENSDLNILRTQAMARLTRRKELDTNATNFNDFLNQRASLGLTGDAETKRIDDEVQRMLIERSPEGTAAAPLSDMLNISPTAREEDLNARMGRIRAAGGEPLGAVQEEAMQGPGPPAGIPRALSPIDILKSIDKKLGDPNQPPAPGVLHGAPAVIAR